MIFVNQTFITFRLWLGLFRCSVFKALCNKIATGSFGGVFANVRVILSLQNCMRRAPTVEFETKSGIRASSMLSARMDKYASRADGGINVCSV